MIPSQQPPIAAATIGRLIEMGTRLPLSGRPSEADLGDALHAILAAEFVNPKHAGREETIGRILRHFDLAGSVRVGDLVEQFERFHSFIGREFRPRSILVETPFTFTNDLGQHLSGFIDLLLETNNGWVIIDHKSFLGGHADFSSKALTYSGQLATYRQALGQCGQSVAGCWIHYVTAGTLVEMTFSKR